MQCRFGLVIPGQEGKNLDLTLLAGLVSLAGSSFSSAGENASGQDLLVVDEVFPPGKGLAKGLECFVERVLPYGEVLQGLAAAGHAVSLALSFSALSRPVVREVVLSKGFWRKLAQMGLPFLLLTQAEETIKPRGYKNFKGLRGYERRFLLRSMSTRYGTCRILWRKRGKKKPVSSHEFRYVQARGKRQGLRHVLRQLSIERQAGFLGKGRLLQLFCYHPFFEECLSLRPNFVRRLASLKVDVVFNWYTFSWVKGS